MFLLYLQKYTLLHLLLLFLFYNYGNIEVNQLLLYGAFIFIGVYGYTTLMDRTSYAIWIELIRGIAGLVLIFISDDWFGVNYYISSGSIFIAIYFGITIFGGIYFTYIEKYQPNQILKPLS